MFVLTDTLLFVMQIGFHFRHDFNLMDVLVVCHASKILLVKHFYPPLVTPTFPQSLESFSLVTWTQDLGGLKPQ